MLLCRDQLYNILNTNYKHLSFLKVRLAIRIVGFLISGVFGQIAAAICKSSAQFSTQYTPHKHKIHAATLPRWTDNLLKTLSILMF
jgi:hypothetical protein